MTSEKLPSETRMGYVHLTVSDLGRAIDFYRQSIGLHLIGRDAGEVSLGTGQRELLRLTEAPGASRVPGRTRLYHFALLVPSRQALGNVLRNLMATQTKISGGADHLVSEALYLDDPDGNGIEIYRDRPREEWKMRHGRPQMDTLPLDFEGILAGAGGSENAWNKLPADSVLGHMHLHVAQLEQAANFYKEVIGFDLQAQLGRSAAFLSAGGYHHHLGINTWAGEGAPPPPEGAVGLRYFSVELPEKAALKQLIGQLQRAQVSYESSADGFYVRDPSQNKMLFVQP
jgi:catechol 2,3-dioxygenase